MFSSVLPFLLALSLFASTSTAKVLDERALPITATTTIVVEATVTETVYWIPAETRLSSAFPTASGTALPTPSLVLVAEPSQFVSSRSIASSSGGTTRSGSATPGATKSATTSSSVQASSTSSSAAAVATQASNSGRPMVAAYYPDWVSWQLSPEQINWSKFDWVDFAFAVLDQNQNLVFTQDNSEDLLRRVVSGAHANGKKVKLSIGGWTGSAFFSNAVSTASKRQALATKMLAMYTKFSLDGIDIDWEYPGVGGADGNGISSSDSPNYLLFLQLLRKTLPAGAKITAAVQVWPFAGEDQNPMRDVSAFAKIFDWITIMNYDVWGSASNGNAPGPNAPLSNGCGNSLQPLANAYAAVNSWVSAGFPANQLALGTAAYGYISKSSATSLVAKRHLSGATHGGSAPRTRRASNNVVLHNDDGGITDGQIMFSDIVKQGALLQDASTRKWVGAGGFTRNWDSCSSTPFLRSTASGQVITYDDPDSLSLKAQFALQAGLHGVNVWDMHGDTSAWVLMDALRGGLGL